MKISMIGLMDLVLLLVVYSYGYCLPIVVSVTPEIVSTGDEVKVTGTSFGADVKVVITAVYSNSSEKITVTPTRVDDKNLKFSAPLLNGGSAKCTFIVNSGGADSSPPKDITIYSSSYINEIVEWKKTGHSNSAMLAHISKKIQEDTDKGKNASAFFQGVDITGGDIDVLTTDAKLDEDTILKLEGQKQYVTIGMSAILLAKTDDLVAAPMLRIFLKPKSYYAPRPRIFTLEHVFSKWLKGFVECFDLNIGYTVIKSHLNNNSNSTSNVNTNYVLAGASYEINKAALLNFGWGIPVNTPQKENGQLYVGITVDINILKSLNIVTP